MAKVHLLTTKNSRIVIGWASVEPYCGANGDVELTNRIEKVTCKNCIKVYNTDKGIENDPVDSSKENVKVPTSLKDRFHNILLSLLGVDLIELKDDAKLVDDLGSDSLDIMEIIMAVEEEFRIEIDIEEETNWLEADMTINKALGLILKNIMLQRSYNE